MSRFKRRGSRLSRSGFTLMESVLALAANSLILLLVGSVLQAVQLQDGGLQGDKNVEWHLFLNQMEGDTKDKVLTLQAQKELQFKQAGTGAIVSYSFRNAEIVRQVYREGYVPLLTGIKEVLYSSATGGVRIRVEFGNGQVLQGFIPVKREEGSGG